MKKEFLKLVLVVLVLSVFGCEGKSKHRTESTITIKEDTEQNENERWQKIAERSISDARDAYKRAEVASRKAYAILNRVYNNEHTYDYCQESIFLNIELVSSSLKLAEDYYAKGHYERSNNEANNAISHATKIEDEYERIKTKY